MPKTSMPPSSTPSSSMTSGHMPQGGPAVEVYGTLARIFHWLTVLLIAVQLPIGMYMVERAESTKFDATTGTLYDTHKLLGVIVLLLVLARLFYRLTNGAPSDEPTLEMWQRLVSHITHWSIYVLLIAVPIGGYLGVSYYGAAAPFGIQLPVFVAKNEDTAKLVFQLHQMGARLLLLLIAMHVGAALFHHFVRKDNVLRRMIGRPR